MREKKYANVLLEDEDKDKLEKIKNIDEEANEEVKLSLTRELKFKELQELEDRLTEEDLNKELNEDYDLTDTSERKIINKKFEDFFDENKSSVPFIAERDIGDDLLMPKDNGTKRIVKAYASKDDKKVDEDGEEIESSKKNEDDIYLTRAFQPLRKRFSFSRFLISLLALLNIAALLFIIYIFFAKPLYQLYINSKPEMVFSNTIDYVFDKLDYFVDSELGENGFYEDFNISANIKSGNVDVINLKDYSYGFGIGNSTKDKTSELNFFMKQGTTKNGYSFIVDDDKKIVNVVNSSTETNSYEVDNKKLESEFESEVYKLLNFISYVNKEDYKYIISSNREIIKDIIKSQKITSKKDVIEVNGEEINVTRNTLELNKDSWNKVIDMYRDSIFDDKELLDIMLKNTRMSSEEFKEAFKNLYEDKDIKNTINIYTVKGVNVVGFDIEENEFRNLYWYKNNKGDFTAYVNMSGECESDDKTCKVTDNMNVYALKGKRNEDNTDVTILHNDKEISNLAIREFFADGFIDLDYNLKKDGRSYKGVLSGNNEDRILSFDISLKYEDIDLDVTVSLNRELNHEFDDVRSEKQLEYDKDNTLSKLDKDFKKLYDLISSYF